MATIYTTIKSWIALNVRSLVLSYRIWQLRRLIVWALRHGTARDLREGGAALEIFGKKYGLENIIALGQQMQWEAEDIVLQR